MKHKTGTKARINGSIVSVLSCDGMIGCSEANIVINDPSCNGQSGCAGSNIEINIFNYD